MGVWVNLSDDPREDVGVFALRLIVNLDDVPEHVELHVSADPRYKLYVGETLVGEGPQRGDPEHWFYDPIDLAPYLRPGRNLVWALVWNFGFLSPVAQMSLRTAFGIRVNDGRFATPGDWEIAPLPGWGFARQTRRPNSFYMAVGPGECVDGNTIPIPESIPHLPLDWRPVHPIRSMANRGSLYEPFWALTRRSIPAMRRGPEHVPVIRRTGLYDFNELLCAYPRLTLIGPAGSEVRITYDEALWVGETAQGAYGEQFVKGNRNDVEGKEARGLMDRVTLGAGPTIFEPLWWRTFRYITVESDAEIRVEHCSARETGYSYQIDSSFTADDPWVEPIWDTAIRTVQRCAGETYFDCPYYEQLQYVGDTRIQALIHYYLSRDRALARNAIEQFGWSLMENGLTQSRYPNATTQTIPPFSLWWILMLADQMFYDDVRPDFLSESTLDRVLDAFRLLLRKPADDQYWAFADWVPEWDAGQPPGKLHAPVHQLLLTYAHQAALMLKQHLAGEPPLPLARTTGDWSGPHKLQFDEHGLVRGSRAVIDDTPSEHAEALRRLVDGRFGVLPPPWPHAALERAGAAKTTLYFSYYKHLAMRPQNYLDELGPWKQMIEDGLTTFAETPDPARSDCHAWSAHPILGFYQIIAGVTSMAPAWTLARIEPNPGALRRFDARIAHPRGELRVAFEDGRFDLDLPIPASFRWQDVAQELSPGRHTI